MFRLASKFKPTGDQPQAIEKLAANFASGATRQTLLGVTGSGKTFTVANVIARLQKPALVISHNKTLAAQLYQEFKEFFPENAVHYFVSYYDYYQPEAYIPSSDTYIEKDAKINELIDSLRHGATASLLTRQDVLIVASVSCIYGIGDPEEYEKVALELKVGAPMNLRELCRSLVLLQYVRNPFDPRPGNFRVRENAVEIHLPSGGEIISVETKDNRIVSLQRRYPEDIRGNSRSIQEIRLFPAKHFITPRQKLKLAMANIRQELKEQIAKFKKEGKLLEAERLEQRTNFDLEMLEHTGYCNGIENYSRHLSFRPAGSPPFTLIDYYLHRFGNDFLTIIDESHVSIPQLRGMYNGDRARKETMAEYGFRLPSAADNRPLKFDEFNKKVNRVLFASATPSEYELQKSAASCPKSDTNMRMHANDSNHSSGIRRLESPCVIEQLIRPTGVLDPKIEVRPTKNQIRDVISEIKKRMAKKERSLVMALTKRLAEDIAEYLAEAGIKSEYIHSEVKTLERPEILKKLRAGEHKALVGINLLREGLDLPEVSFIAILDADKEGFLRDETTLLQIIGRAARHAEGTVILYADTVTESMRKAIEETARRRKIQEEYNRTHGITPETVKKEIRKSLLEELAPKSEEEIFLPAGPTREMILALKREMKRAAREMNFELAAKIRDKIRKYRT